MKNKKIGIIGAHPIFFSQNAVDKELLDFTKDFDELKEEQDSPTVTVVDEPQQQLQQRIIEVNGVQYVEKQKSKTHSRPRSMMLDMYVDQFLEMEYSKTKQLPDDVDIVKEYGLIELKTCKLPRWQREIVVSIFERRYIKF